MKKRKAGAARICRYILPQMRNYKQKMIMETLYYVDDSCNNTNEATAQHLEKAAAPSF